MNSSSVLNFTVDKSLLNLEFEGYKLILEDIPVRQQVLPNAIYQPEIGQNQYTLLHQHLFFSHNFLFHDFWWNPSDEECAKLYAFTSDGTVICINYSRACETFTFLKMFDVPVPEHNDHTDKYNATLSFPSSDFVCISNGFGTLWICARKKVWSEVFAAENFLGENKAFVIADSIQRTSANGKTVIDLLLKTVDVAVVSVDNNFSTCLHWITVEENGSTGWTTERRRVVTCTGRVEYSCFSRRQDIPMICLVHAGAVRFIKDTKYLTFGLNVDQAADAAKADSYAKTAESEASDVIEASAVSASAEPQLNSIPDNEIEPITSRPAFNPEDMEECDMVSAEDLQLSWVHGEKHNVVRKADLSSHQWMFECRVSADEPPYIVLRYDVDGLMWRVPSDPFEPGIDAEGYDHLHCATLHAFGYIQAAKESRRLVACSPDATYSVIADQRRQVYLYWSPASSSGCELRNRRAASQKQVQHVSRQHLLTIDASQHILGLQALNSFLFVLTNVAIYAFLLPSPEQ